MYRDCIIYSVSRLNEPKVSEAKYKFDCRCKIYFAAVFFVPNLFCSGELECKIYFAAIFFVPNLFCVKLIMFFGNAAFAYRLGISVLYSIGKRYNKGLDRGSTDF